MWVRQCRETNEFSREVLSGFFFALRLSTHLVRNLICLAALVAALIPARAADLRSRLFSVCQKLIVFLSQKLDALFFFGRLFARRRRPQFLKQTISIACLLNGCVSLTFALFPSSPFIGVAQKWLHKNTRDRVFQIFLYFTLFVIFFCSSPCAFAFSPLGLP
jgi:hypothetical protein